MYIQLCPRHPLGCDGGRVGYCQQTLIQGEAAIIQTTEQRLERLEKRNKRLTTALTLMAVAMCAAVTVE